VSYRLYDAADFGVPQHRRRVIFFLSRDSETIEPMVLTHGGDDQPRHLTLRDAVGHLQGTVMEAHPITPSMLECMQHVPAGGDWRSIPLELRPAWSLKPMKNSIDNWYHRSAWDEPCRTLTCDVGQQPKAPHCHPDELRGLSVEECAAIQTFPERFVLAGSRRQKYKQLGNAVPVKFATAVAEHLLAHMAMQENEAVEAPGESQGFSAFAVCLAANPKAKPARTRNATEKYMKRSSRESQLVATDNRV
jgi:DNA (cytosine-5)-methyltransferase 1